MNSDSFLEFIAILLKIKKATVCVLDAREGHVEDDLI